MGDVEEASPREVRIGIVSQHPVRVPRQEPQGRRTRVLLQGQLYHIASLSPALGSHEARGMVVGGVLITARSLIRR
jgi:hypothetical protein